MGLSILASHGGHTSRGLKFRRGFACGLVRGHGRAIGLKVLERRRSDFWLLGEFWLHGGSGMLAANGGTLEKIDQGSCKSYHAHAEREDVPNRRLLNGGVRRKCDAKSAVWVNTSGDRLRGLAGLSAGQGFWATSTVCPYSRRPWLTLLPPFDCDVSLDVVPPPVWSVPRSQPPSRTPWPPRPRRRPSIPFRGSARRRWLRWRRVRRTVSRFVPGVFVLRYGFADAVL